MSDTGSAGTQAAATLFYGNDRTKIVARATDLIEYLPPDKRHHYRDGYSMAEAAKCWVAAGGRLPRSVAERIGSSHLEYAHFEYGVQVWGGGRSMTDVMAFTANNVVAIEAKARETFDEEIRAWIVKRQRENPASPPHRREVIRQYADALGISEIALMELRYQLFQRALAAALTAKRFGLRSAWMIVQSFCPLDCAEHVRNRGDFDRFVAVVGEAPVFIEIPVRLAWVEG